MGHRSEASAAYSRARMTSLPPPSSAESRIGITLETFITEGMRGHPDATGTFTSLLNQIGLSAKLVTSKVRRAGLANVLGYTGEVNVQGERVMKLDEEANTTLIATLRRKGHCAAVASEELDEPVIFTDDQRARYIVAFDPLDGSSNIDVNISIGTIFGLWRRTSWGPVSEKDFLRPGRELAAAGYVIYGSSTMVVLSTGLENGVHGFTYDPTVGEFFLSHENIRIPKKGNTYSINEGNFVNWPQPVKNWNSFIKEENKEEGRPYGARYVGTLVADGHRTLLRGGIFAYPADLKSPQGKLRLLYEAAPFAFLFEAAGGVATDGSKAVLDIRPEKLHQRTGLALGSPDDMAIYGDFMQGVR